MVRQVLVWTELREIPSGRKRVNAILERGVAPHLGRQRTEQMANPLLLFERNGGIWVKFVNNGHVDTAPQELKLGQPIEIGGASMVLEPWRVRVAGSSGD